MGKTDISFNFSEEDKATIKEAVQEVVSEAITDFGFAQRQSLNFKSSTEACKVLGITKPTLARYRAKGYLTGKCVSGKYFYSDDELSKAASIDLKYKH